MKKMLLLLTGVWLVSAIVFWLIFSKFAWVEHFIVESFGLNFEDFFDGVAETFATICTAAL